MCARLPNLTPCLHVSSSPLPPIATATMDWSPRETFLAPNAIDEFYCDVEAEHPMTVLYKFNPNHQSDEERPVQRFSSKPPKPGSGEPDFSIPNFWEEFKSLPIFRLTGPGPNRKLPSGLCVFFCPRANPVFDDVPSELSDLCLPRAEWENIASKFSLNNLLVKAIRQKITSISVEPHHLVRGDRYYETRDTLLMCTVTSQSPGSSGGDEFAVSSTHFKNANLTLAVVFGATPKQVNKVADLLANADEAIGHPLLILGLAAELMLDNLVDPVERMRDECIRVIRLLREMISVTDRKGTHYAMEVESIRSESVWLDEAAKTTKDNLKNGLAVYNKVTGSIDNDEDDMADRANKPERGDEEFEANLKRYVDHKMNMRFQDILAQLDVLIAVTRISVQDMCSMSTTMTSELNRRDAADSAQTAKTGTLIAFLAMLYLPITSVATIFATPVFNFGNDWRDWRFQPTSTGNTSSPDRQSDSSSEPVFSGYFWIYFGISVALTFLTMEGWWRVAGQKPQETVYGNTWHGGPPKPQKRQLPHWILWPVWWYLARFFPVKDPDSSDTRPRGRGAFYDDSYKDGSTSAGGGSREKSETRTFTASITPGPGGSSGALRPDDGTVVITDTTAATGSPPENSGGAGGQSGAIQQAISRFRAAARRGNGGGSPVISAV